MKMVGRATLAAWLIAVPVLAFNEPDGLQMLKFGQDVRNALPKCDTVDAMDRSQKPCWRHHEVWVADESKLAIDNIKVGEFPLKIEVEQIDEKLEKFFATLPGPRFRELSEALEARYGKPTSSTSVTYQNAMGAKLEYPRRSWVGKTVVVSIEEAPLNIRSRDTIGFLTYVTTKYLARSAAEDAQKRNKAAKDL